MPELQISPVQSERTTTFQAHSASGRTPPAELVDVARSMDALRKAPEVVSLSEVQRYTGMAPERLRTWGRRFDFPKPVTGPTGRRGIATEDLPAIVAAGQLIADGLPVAEAIEQVRAGLPVIDISVFERSYGALSVPVVLLGGPHPLEVVWANRAAGGATGAPLAPPDPSARVYRAFQRMLIDFDGAAAVVNHAHWTDAELRMESLAWTVGSPAARPPLVLVMGLGDEAVDLPDAPHDVREHADARWASAIARSRRELQRGVAASAISDAFAALVDGSPADDGFFVLVREAELRPASSVRGERRASRVHRSGWLELQGAWDNLEPVWLSDGLAHELHVPDRRCLALPLASRGRLKGFAVLEFAGAPELSPPILELLMAWSTAAAACQSRDAAAALRAR